MDNYFKDIRDMLGEFAAIRGEGILKSALRNKHFEIKTGQELKMAHSISLAVDARLQVMDAALRAARARVHGEVELALLDVERHRMLEAVHAQQAQIAAPAQQALPGGEQDVPLTTYAADDVVNSEASKIARCYPKGKGRAEELAFERKVVTHLRGKGFSAADSDLVLERVHEMMDTGPY